MATSMLSELLAQKTALEQQILEVQREERAGAIAQVRALMSQYGLTLADLGSRAPAATGKVAPRTAGYRHPATGETWAGRGPRPRWLKAALAEGARLEDFKV